MRFCATLALLLLLPPLLMGQEAGSPLFSRGELASLASRIEEIEAELPPLAPLPEQWQESLRQLKEVLLVSGAHRSEARYGEALSYLLRRAEIAALPVELIRESGERSRALLAAVEGASQEELIIENLTRSSEALGPEARESSALDALRRSEVELLGIPGLEAKVEVAASLTEAFAIVEEELEGISPRELPAWGQLLRILETAASGREGLGELREELAPVTEPTERIEETPTVGIPEQRIVALGIELSPSVLELLVRHDRTLAIAFAGVLDRYRWNLAPSGEEALLAGRLALIEESHHALRRETLSRQAQRIVTAQLAEPSGQAADRLREELLEEGEAVVERYRSRRGEEDSDARRWALLSLLSHPYAQVALHAGEDDELLAATTEAVDALYEEVDRRASELLTLVARRYELTQWNFRTERLPGSFDRLVTITGELPEGESEEAATVASQLRSAYERAFNLLTNPEQNEEVPRTNLPPWSMLHGQYVEVDLRRLDGLTADVRRWFDEAQQIEEARGAFPLVHRGYQRLHYAQQRWLRQAQERYPRRMWPEPSAELAIVAEQAEAFLSGEGSRLELEALCDRFIELPALAPYLRWARKLSEEQDRFARVSSGEVTTALLDALEGAGAEGGSRPELEALLHRIDQVVATGLLDPATPVDELYRRWREAAAISFLPPGAGVAEVEEALEALRRYTEAGFLPPGEAQELYRSLSRRAIELLAGNGEVADE